MDNQKTEFDIGGKLLIAFVTGGAMLLGAKYMDYKNKSAAIKSGIPIKDNSDIQFEFDPQNKKYKFIRKADFEVKETKTIIKEVPVVPGFKKTKKVRVQVDQDGIEIPGTEEDIMG